MAKINPWRIGFGAGAILLGAYISLTFYSNLIEAILGIVIIAIGISLIASS
jgi:hypothetical protein